MTLITLIPKVSSPKRVQEYIPISLCNVLYKIVSKSITNQLRLVLDDYRGGKTGFTALKLDMSKAYNRVEWSFFQEMRDQTGFCRVVGRAYHAVYLLNFLFFPGVSIATACPSISHIFFADDSLIFCRARPEECTQLRSCLIYYSKASR
ncbi:hypothetical protein UlMin_004431 [Ulmus minor]